MIYPHIVSKENQESILPVQRITKKQKSHSGLEVTMLTTSHFACLFLNAVGMGIASLILFGCYFNAAVAQTPTTQKQMHLRETPISQVNVLFVNPSVGNDKQGNGGESTPLKTITQALRVASPNTVIMLAKGTYSAQTGELFPLILKPNVSLQGNVNGKGSDIIISGGGDYLSRSFGSKNVAIVGAKGAQLSGLTVTNSNPRGYGLWIESSDFTVTDNTFTGNTQDGITVTGKATPIIRNNLFLRNGANGITVTDSSRAEIRDNVFQETGFGINITQKAEPVIVSNQIQNNRSGIIVQASSRPVLRNNLIEGSKEDGLVVLAQATPDLGNTSEAGGNQFRNNGRYDINASAAKQVIAAYGNSLVGDRIAGKINTSATAVATVQKSPSQSTQVNQEITFSAPGISDPKLKLTPTASSRTLTSLPILQSSQTLPPPPVKVSAPSLSTPSVGTSSPQKNTSRPLNNPLIPLQPANSTATRTYNRPKPKVQPVNSKVVVTATKPKTVPISRNAAGFPIPSSLPGWQKPNTPQVNYVQVAPNSIEFVAPQLQPSSKPVAAVPIKVRSNQSQLLPAQQPTSIKNSNQVPISNNPITTAYAGSSMTGRFRVMAEIQSQRDQELVRFLAPGAFPTFWQGKAVMQAGLFGSRQNAEQMLNILNNNGLRTAIEQVGY